MSRIWSILSLVVAVLLVGPARGAEPSPREDELKARFSQRYDTLQRLKNAQKVGETTDGLVAVVRDAYADERVSLPDDRSMTVRELVQAENADRRQLYRVIGNRTGEPANAVAQQAAIRNFSRASPSHYLRLRSGSWVQKKELPAPK